VFLANSGLEEKVNELEKQVIFFENELSDKAGKLGNAKRILNEKAENIQTLESLAKESS